MFYREWNIKTTNELDPLKGLTRLLTREDNEEGKENHLAQESYLEELLGKLQENLTEVLWQ